MPKFILLEAVEGFAHGCVSTKVTGSDHVGHARHEHRRPAASSGGQVEHGGSAGAPLPHLHRNRERIRTLSARRQAAGADANAEGSHENVCGHRTWTLARGTKSSGTYS